MQNLPDLWLSCYPVPKRGGHKYDRGHALIYGGDVMTGAARLAARAAQRMGAGLVTLVAPAKAVPIYAEALESVIVREADSIDAWRDLLADPKRNAVLIGPGLGRGAFQSELTLEAVKAGKACVLDADALTNFADHPENLFSVLHDQCVLTPHEGEFAKLFDTYLSDNAQFLSRLRERLGVGRDISGSSQSSEDFEGKQTSCPPSVPEPAPAKAGAGGREALTSTLDDKINRALQASKLAGCVVLLKGADTIIAAPDGNFVLNNNAPPWLATAGAGDVLAGLILGLVVQKMPVFWAAAAAAWIHGKIAAGFGPGLIAEDLVDGIPTAIKELIEIKQP